MTALVALLIPIAFVFGVVAGGAWEFCRKGGTHDLLHRGTRTARNQVDHGQLLVEDLATAA